MDIEHQKDYFRDKILPRNFYTNKDNNEFSKSLLGKYFIQLNPIPMGGVIVETESYPGKGDIASHHHHEKITDRTKTIFNPIKGLLYVYMVYGLHYCFGVTSGDDNNQNVTLIRAIKPIFGIERLREVRKTEDIKNLLSGPAKITKALNITKNEDGHDLVNGNIIICDFKEDIPLEIGETTRVGIKDNKDGYREKPWRFYIKNSKYISTKV